MSGTKFKWLRQFITLIGVLFTFYNPLYSQGIFKHYDRSNGLLSNKIYGILQDTAGLIWINSENGIQQFDGANFINFQTTEGLSTNDIPFVRLDNGNKIWAIGFDRSLQVLDKGKVTKLGYIKTLYYGTNLLFIDSTIFVVDGIEIKEYSQDLKLRKIISLPSEFLFSGGITMSWINERKHICFTVSGANYEYFKGKITKLNIPTFNCLRGYTPPELNEFGTIILEKNRIVAIKGDSLELLYQAEYDRFDEPKMTLDQNNDLFFVSNKQLYKLKIGSEPKAIFKPKGNITFILIGRGGNIWLSTYDGVYKIDNRFTAFQKMYEFDYNHSFNLIYYDKLNNQFFFGDHDSRLVLMKNGKTCTIETNFRKSYNEIKKIIQTDNHTFLIGNDEGLFKFVQSPTIQDKFTITKLIGGNVKEFFYINDTIYCSMGIQGVFQLINDNANNFYITRTYAMCQNQNSNIIFSTAEGLKWYSSDTIGSFYSDYLTKNSFKKLESINAERVLFLSNRSELGILNPNTEKIIFFNSKRTTEPIEIFDWQLGDFNVILLNSSAGLLKTSLFKIENDLPYENLTEKSVQPIESSSKEIYLIADNILYETSLLAKTVVNIPDLGVYVINKLHYSQLDKTGIKLKHNNNSINLAVFDKKHGNAKHFYRLIGYSDNWFPLLNGRLDLVNLSPNEYILEIRSLLANGKWSEKVAYDIIVVPRLIDRVWFRFLIICGVILVLGFIIRTKLESLRNTSKYAKAQINALSLQMNPHFISNSITSIQHLILGQKDPAVPMEYLSRFSDMSISILNASEENYVLLSDEIKQIENYIALEQLRFQGKFEFNIEILGDFNLDEYLIPPMFLQPIIENGIKHGMSNNAEKGNLNIKFILSDSALEVWIEDNGKGIAISNEPIKSQRRKSITFENLYDRINLYKKLYNYSIDFSITSNSEGKNSGTKIIFVFPKRIKK